MNKALLAVVLATGCSGFAGTEPTVAEHHNHVVVDRIEGNFAITFDYEGVEIWYRTELLPEAVSDGDVLDFDLTVDHHETEARRAQATAILNALRARS